MKRISFIIYFMLLSVQIFSISVSDSGGKLIPEQAAYDITFYSINLEIKSTDKTIAGFTNIKATVLTEIEKFVLNLNSVYTIDSIVWKGSENKNKLMQYTHEQDRINITLFLSIPADGTVDLEVYYKGKPKEANNPPWDDGFVWNTSSSGKTWAGVACESEGGDIWWPCKDHPSDEPDSVALNFTVQSDLTCVSNGKLLGVTDNPDNTKTYKWFVSNPINNYNVTFYLGEYEKIPIQYTSVTGNPIPSEWWFLKENKSKAENHIKLFLKDLKFLEEKCGPFPFRGDKYSIAEAPYWGMEHQSIIAYGNNFQLNSFGFDYIHFHELAHEWWGNLVSAKDWSDAWIHEGLATYMEALFTEELHGKEKYKEYVNMWTLANPAPIAPRVSVTASEIFNRDIYYKGAWVVHTLRYLIGDETFFKVLRRWAYSDSTKELVTNGEQCRLATTDEFLKIAENISGKELSWFWEIYLRRGPLPKLKYEITNDKLSLNWEVQENLPFILPVEVKLGEDIIKVAMPNGRGEVSIPSGITPVIDPDSWILMEKVEGITNVKEDIALIPNDFNLDVYPNPFNPETKLQLNIGESQNIDVEVFSMTGQSVWKKSNTYYRKGKQNIRIDLSKQSSGTYFLVVKSKKRQAYKKLLLLK